MRDIKFRAWVRYQKTFWHSGTVVRVTLGHDLQAELGEDIVLQQFTGLKDKNGKEIYEGDIVSAKNYYAARPWWKDLEHKKQIDASWEEQKLNIQDVRSAIRFDDGSFEWGRRDFGDFLLSTFPDGGRYVWELHSSGNTVGGEYEERYWDFEVIGNIYENPDLLK